MLSGNLTACADERRANPGNAFNSGRSRVANRSGAGTRGRFTLEYQTRKR
jgi:hypothetical protein